MALSKALEPDCRLLARHVPGDLLATLRELEHLGVGVGSLTEALDLTTPAGRATAGLTGYFRRVRKGDSAGADPGPAWCMRGQQPGRPATAAVHTAEIRKLTPLA